MASTDTKHSFFVMSAVVTLCIATVWLFDDVLWDNETQRMVVVKHFLDSSWIPNDWFLNTPMIYQIPFNLVASPLVALFELGTATILLRFILYSWFATGVVALAKRLGIGLGALVPAVMVATSLWGRYLAASEWMVAHAESKVIAYGAVLWAFSFLIGKRYTAAAAFLGLGTTFHVLVGLYAVLTSSFFLLAHPRHRRSFVNSMPSSLPVFLLTGSFGLFTVAQNLLSAGRGDPFTDLIYVARNPHHVWPPIWSKHVHLYLPAWVDGYMWLAKSAMSLAFLALVAVRSRSQTFREYAQLALSSMPFFAIGLLLYAIGPVGFLKYLPFRFPDVLIPFTAFLLFFGEAERIARDRDGFNLSPFKRTMARVGLIGIASLAIPAGVFKASTDLRIKKAAGVPWGFVRLSPEDRSVTMWIRENTPTDALFLADPKIAPFYVAAERGMMVSWKHFPQNEQDVREWHDRLVALNRNRSIIRDPSGIEMEEIQDSFNTLPLDIARNLADRYGLDYYYGPHRADWAIRPVYQNGHRAVYQLR